MRTTPLTNFILRSHSRFPAWQTQFVLLVLVVLSTGCGNMFQSMVAKYGPTTDEQGATELAALAEAGREQLSRGDYLPAIESAPKIWAGLSTSDSRKGGIATLYFREFCDALYATDGKLPAFEVASLLQLAAEGFPSKTWQEDFVKSDRERLLKMSSRCAISPSVSGSTLARLTAAATPSRISPPHPTCPASASLRRPPPWATPSAATAPNAASVKRFATTNTSCRRAVI